MKHNNYNRIAWCYDLLSHLIFGNAIKKAQADLLNFIPGNASILITGGGTGWILEEIAKLYPGGLLITYIDASYRMISKSKKRRTGLNTIKFISQPVEQVKLATENYDVIITPFFFDNFSQAKCSKVFQQLHNSLRKEGIWLFTDFQVGNNGEYWQKPLLNLMYLFFRIVCRLEAVRLPAIDQYFLNRKYKKLAEKTYYKNFIVSKVFQKT